MLCLLLGSRLVLKNSTDEYELQALLSKLSCQIASYVPALSLEFVEHGMTVVLRGHTLAVLADADGNRFGLRSMG